MVASYLLLSYNGTAAATPLRPQERATGKDTSTPYSENGLPPHSLCLCGRMFSDIQCFYPQSLTLKWWHAVKNILGNAVEGIRYKGNLRIDAAAVHFMGGKQGDILWLPGGKYLHRHTNLATHLGDFPFIE